jgi:hypothetical protein
MNPALYNTALVAHIIGITIMAGTTFIDFITFRQFWKIYPEDKIRSASLEEYLFKLQRFFGIGMLIIIISGVSMMAYLHQVWGAQLWFRVKIGILVLIIINGLALRRRQGSKLKSLMTSDLSGHDLKIKTSSLKRNITLTQLLQILFFILIYFLSVFKFS